MNELQVFENKEFGKIRAIEISNEPYFVAKDVCEILEIKNTTDVIKRLDRDEVTRLNLGGRQGNVNLVNEYGLYTLILGSRKKEAKQFKRWITHEVLPSIRKHGGYLTETKIEEVLLNPDTIIKLATDLKNERMQKEKLQIENNEQKQLIGELKPKADYTDRILQCDDLTKVNVIACDYGFTAIEFNKLLKKLGIQYREGKDWLLYKKYRGKGYTQTKTFEYTRKNGTIGSRTTMYWTQKGRLFIYNFLKEKGIVPAIEREVA